MLIALLHPEHRVATCGENGAISMLMPLLLRLKNEMFFFWLEIQTYVHELALL